MEISTNIAVPVIDSSHTSATRQRATELAESAGFAETDAHRVGLVATELATNLVKHANGGAEMMMRIVGTGPHAEVELLALDRGPGIVDVRRSLEDGYSTAGSSGTGLGAIRRLSDTFDLYSQVGKGTAVIARLRLNRQPAATSTMIVGAVSLPMTGEDVCGDTWRSQARPSGIGILVADGLGHGLHAADAAAAAAVAFGKPFTEPSEAVDRIHHAIRHTRGAAGAVAEIRLRERIVRYAGVGNITGVICGATASRQMVSMNGTLGHQVRQIRDYSYPWEPGSLLVMHSDGLSGSWSLDGYPGLRVKHPSVIAATLYRDFARGRDDATVIVAREAA